MRRFWIALLASLAIHALLLLAVRAPRREREPPDIEVEIVQRDLPPPRHEEPAPPSPGAEHRPRISKGRVKGPPSPGPAASPATPAPSEPAGIGEARDLRLGLPLPAAPAPAPAPVARPEAPPLTEKQALETKLDGFWRESKARHQAVELHDDYWYGVKKKLEEGFDPPSEVVKSGPNTAPSLLVRAIRQYLAQAAAYGSTGNPDGDEPEGDRRRGELDDVAAAGRPDRARAGSYHSAYNHEIAVIVQLRQDGTGSVVGAEVLESSGNPLYDRLALEHVRAIDLTELGPPIGGRRTLWAFQTTLHTQPPLPQAGCSFDAYFQIVECTWPLHETIHSHVSLVALYEDRPSAR